MQKGDKVWIPATVKESGKDQSGILYRIWINDDLEGEWFADNEVIPAEGKVIVSEKRLRAVAAVVACIVRGGANVVNIDWPNLIIALDTLAALEKESTQ